MPSDRPLYARNQQICGDIRMAYLDEGAGATLLLLHGWPEFSAVWEPLIERLAPRGYRLIAADLRGFGESDKPELDPSSDVGEDVHAHDVLSLMDALGVEQFGIVGHDIGAVIGQRLARSIPEYLTGLFFFDCPHPGIGKRWGEPAQLQQNWHFDFHQQPWAAELVGSSRAACRTYLAHFLRHWAARPDTFAHVLERWVDEYMKPGNLQGGFNWYVSRGPARERAMASGPSVVPPITVPTCVRWGDRDRALPAAWGELLGPYFTDLDFAPFEGAGHFPHFEAPDAASEMVDRFFQNVLAPMAGSLR